MKKRIPNDAVSVGSFSALGADGRLTSLGEEDDGVYIIREPQAFVANDCLGAMTFDAQRLFCRFNQDVARQLGFDDLDIQYQLEPEEGQQVQAWHGLIFQPRADDWNPTT